MRKTLLSSITRFVHFLKRLWTIPPDEGDTQEFWDADGWDEGPADFL